MDYDTIWEEHEKIAVAMVELVRDAAHDAGLEDTSPELLTLARSAPHPEILACILSVQQANLLNAYTHDVIEPRTT